MKVESISVAGGSPQPLPRAADKVEAVRKQKEDGQAEETPQVQPEEILGQIKALTEDGLYSVRFENDERSNDLVVKIVDRDTDEVIRQVPVEEILQLRQALENLSGNIVNLTG